jgi:hypothetical protein
MGDGAVGGEMSGGVLVEKMYTFGMCGWQATPTPKIFRLARRRHAQSKKPPQDDLNEKVMEMKVVNLTETKNFAFWSA